MPQGLRAVAVEIKHRVRHYEESACPLSGHSCECTVEVVETSGLQELKLHSQRPGRDLHVSYRARVRRIGRVREDRHPADFGDGTFEQLQLLLNISRPKL